MLRRWGGPDGHRHAFTTETRSTAWWRRRPESESCARSNGGCRVAGGPPPPRRRAPTRAVHPLGSQRPRLRALAQANSLLESEAISRSIGGGRAGLRLPISSHWRPARPTGSPARTPNSKACGAGRGPGLAPCAPSGFVDRAARAAMRRGSLGSAGGLAAGSFFFAAGRRRQDAGYHAPQFWRLNKLQRRRSRVTHPTATPMEAGRPCTNSPARYIHPQ